MYFSVLVFWVYKRHIGKTRLKLDENIFLWESWVNTFLSSVTLHYN